MSTSTAASAAPPAITFPSHIFASVAPHSYLQAHFTNKSSTHTRPNGRLASEFRSPSVNTGSLTQCSGSSVVRLGNTAVVCGVRAEILRVEDVPNAPEPAGEDEDDTSELSSLGVLVPNVELSTGCAPSHIPGNAPTATAQMLVQRARDLLYTTKLVQAADLRILKSTTDEDGYSKTEVVAYWTLYIDILFISLDGGAFDAAWGAVVAALKDVRLPRCFWDSERDMLLCSDIPSESTRLTQRGFPVAVSFAVFESPDSKAVAEILADPDAFEEELCGETACIVLDCSQAPIIKRIEKSGGGVVGRKEMQDLVQASQSRWATWKSVIDG